VLTRQIIWGKILGSFPRSLVLLHGYAAGERNWERVVFGIPPNLPGRIPTAIAEAIRINADIILFGSSVGKEVDGVRRSSGYLMTELLKSRYGDLKEFTILRELKDIDKKKVVFTFELVEDEERPANTTGELQALKRIIKQRDLRINNLTCVSSRDHVSRIIRDANIVFNDDPLVASLCVRGSVTMYTEEDGKTSPEMAKMDNVVVIEPRSTLVRPVIDMFGASPDALADINAVLQKHSKQGKEAR